MLRTVTSSMLFVAAVLGDQVPEDYADSYGSKCMDGSTPTYELTRNTSSTKWVLFLEGGGWRWPPAHGFEKNVSLTTRYGNADIGGIMGQDPATNPDFHTWNKIFMHYCDGASFGSGRVEKYKNGAWYRGRNNFNAVISYAQSNLGMNNATEVILSGGSAGGLAVFFNLDHLATLLQPGTRLTGFPDAGFFLDGANAGSGQHNYRDSFIAADPIWNVTGSGGTNAACLADQKAGEEWKCLMAPYIAPYIKTPIFVMNSAYDAWQMGNILGTPCLPAPDKAPCTADQVTIMNYRKSTNATLRAYHDQFLEDIKGVTAGKPDNGVYIDGCYVHEQNVNYCSGQGMPNCVGWSPLESGSKKWGYTTSVKVPDGRQLTPQQAFGAYYRGDKGAFIAVDSYDFFDNPSCFYRGKPMPTPAPPPSPAPTPTPAPPPPAPKTITCDPAHTPCAAAYSESGEGCCVLKDAVCCPNKQTCCPKGTKCNDDGGYLAQCTPISTVAPVPPPTPSLSVCKPGPQKPFSATLKNIIVLGDSVSIGYTPAVAANLSDVALVQHAPYDNRDGGAEETAYGLQCLDYFVKGPQGNLLEPDILMFNFGLHDGPLGNKTVPGQQGNSSVYPHELEQIVLGLLKIFPASSKTKLLFALTSPMLCNANADGNVVALNNVASTIMAAHGVATLDNHGPIVAKCGPVPTASCFSQHGCFCPHCANDGYEWLAQTVIAPALSKMLTAA